MKKNNYIMLMIFIINLIALPLILNKHLECNLIKWTIFTLFIIFPKIISKKISINNTIELLYLILIFFSFVLGRTYGLYVKIGWFDTLVHFIFGILGMLFVITILKNQKDKRFNTIFSFLLTVFMCVLWEFIEMGCDYIIGTNMMKIKETGIMDTMKDISIAMISSIITGTIYIKKSYFK